MDGLKGWNEQEERMDGDRLMASDKLRQDSWIHGIHLCTDGYQDEMEQMKRTEQIAQDMDIISHYYNPILIFQLDNRNLIEHIFHWSGEDTCFRDKEKEENVWKGFLRFAIL